MRFVRSSEFEMAELNALLSKVYWCLLLCLCDKAERETSERNYRPQKLFWGKRIEGKNDDDEFYRLIVCVVALPREKSRFDCHL